ncbi:peptidase MA family protein [Leptospira ilyithenensis]|uniref:Peptidase MA family protein n=1 Tax=Leptospira ilyithenensis TaxID=2484901 RepID=A0A4R9LSU5_9LEPT|nr:peptidase MA family protein [Leptospira ilyithenensis]TGN11675.1 peptidase MA family protein [Leptospira ilyithenensis]
MFQKKIILLFIFVINLFPIFAQDPSRVRVPYLQGTNRTDITRYKWGITAPNRFEDISGVPIPQIGELRLKFPVNTPSFYSGPDGGEVYLWKKDNYRWTRSDGSILTEWENGTWKLETPDGPNFTSFGVFGSCSGCLPKIQLDWKDGSKLIRDWVPHRKEFAWVFQKNNASPALNWQLIDPSKTKPGRFQVSKYSFYHSSDWDLYLQALKENFPADEFFAFAKKEFDMENIGQVPVLLFDKNGEMSAYQGKELPGGSEEGGFGGQNSITLCCGEKQIKPTGNSVLDEDAKKRAFLGTFYHETIHNLEQMTCLSYKSGLANLPKENLPDPWFDEGIANYIAGQFSISKKYYIYEELDKKIQAGKIPSSYAALLKHGYQDLLPYSLGAYMVEYMHKSYGSKTVVNYNKDTCLGTDSALALEKATGVSADQFISLAVADFQSKKSVLFSDSKKKTLQGYTVMAPVNVKAFQNFLEKGFSLPASPFDIQNYEEIPSVRETFLASVEPFFKKIEGDFDGPGESTFFLWKSGIYKWQGKTWEATYFPGNQTVFKKDGWSVIEWEDGKRRVVSSDGTSVMFWKKDQKGYFDSAGKQIKK